MRERKIRVMDDTKNRIMLNEIMDWARSDGVRIDNIIAMAIVEWSLDEQDEGIIESWIDKYLDMCDYEMLRIQGHEKLVNFCHKMVDYVSDRYFKTAYWEAKQLELDILKKFKELIELADNDSIAEIEADYFLTDFKQEFGDVMEYEDVCYWIDKLEGKDKSTRRIGYRVR